MLFGDTYKKIDHEETGKSQSKKSQLKKNHLKSYRKLLWIQSCDGPPKKQDTDGYQY